MLSWVYFSSQIGTAMRASNPDNKRNIKLKTKPISRLIIEIMGRKGDN